MQPPHPPLASNHGRRASVTLAWGFGRTLLPPAGAEEADAGAGRVGSHPRRFRAASTSPPGVGAAGSFQIECPGFRFRTTAQPALAMVGSVAAIALWPNRACVVAPAVNMLYFIGVAFANYRFVSKCKQRFDVILMYKYVIIFRDRVGLHLL